MEPRAACFRVALWLCDLEAEPTLAAEAPADLRRVAWTRGVVCGPNRSCTRAPESVSRGMYAICTDFDATAMSVESGHLVTFKNMKMDAAP